MNYNSFYLFLPYLFLFCLCEISEVKKSKLLSDFINYYNLRPNVDLKASDGFLQSISEIDDTTYQIEVSFKAQHNDVSKMMKCQAGIEDLGEEGIATVNNAIDCIELEQQDADASLEAVDDQAEGRTVMLDNEDEVDPEVQEVQVLANMGVRHLDIHDPSSKHRLNSVIDVKRQVQVFNGIRYILTLSINFNKCTKIINNLCNFTKTCRFTILIKPWQTLPSGAKYRTVLANNCTKKKLFSGDDEALSEFTDSNDHIKIDEKTFAHIDEINIKRYEDVNSLPNREKTLTVDKTKTWNWKSDNLSQPNKGLKKEYVLKTKSNPQFKRNSIPGRQSMEAKTGSLSHDKKKSIDEMLDFLNVSGYKPQVHSRTEDSVKSSKRSYDYDLQVLYLTQDYRDFKKSIENAKVYKMAQVMVDYLNIKDIEVKNRAVKNVMKAEEDDDKHFFYIQVQVVIPCDTQNCDRKDTQTKICNGVVDSTNKVKPQVLYSFCYNDNKEMAVLDKFKEIKSDDPVLLRLSEEALKQKKIESTEPHVMKIKKTISANTRLTSKETHNTHNNRNTQLGGEIEQNSKNPIYLQIAQDSLQKYLKSTANRKRYKVVQIKKVTSQIVEGSMTRIHFTAAPSSSNDHEYECFSKIWEQPWVNKKQIDVSCVNPNQRAKRASSGGHIEKNPNNPLYIDLAKESLKKYNNKNQQSLSFVRIDKVTLQVVTGTMTRIHFIAAPNSNDREYNCFSEIWEQTWVKEKTINVSCVNLNQRSKRQLLGGETEQNPNDPLHIDLAE